MLESKLNHEAIEAFAVSFSQKVCNSFFDEKDVVSGREIVEITPVKQVNYFVLKILFRQWQKETLRLQSPYFNYRNEEVRKALVGFMNVLSQQISVRREHFEPLLRKATREALLLIISPYDFFREELTGHESGRLNDKYLKNSDKYIKVNRRLFDVYKSRFDALGEGDMPHEDALALLDDVFMSRELVPEETAAYEEAFNEVEKVDFADFFHGEPEAYEPEPDEQQDEEESIWEESDFSQEADEDDLTDDMDEGDDEGDDDTDEYLEDERTEIDDDDEGESIEDKYETLEDLEERQEAEAGEGQGSAYRFLENVGSDDDDDDMGDSALNRQFSSEKQPLHEKLKAEKGPTLAEIHQSQKIESIVGSISINQRYMFVNELFKGENEVFVAAMSKVEGCSSFDEAVELLIQNYSKDLEWDMNTPEVKELLKIIFKKFR